MTFDATSWTNKTDIKIIAWAQNTMSSGPSEVYQAARWFIPIPGDFNGDRNVDSEDYDTFTLDCFTGPDGGPIDPACTPGDFDEDDDVDCDDWDQFVLAWTAGGDPPAFETCVIASPEHAAGEHSVLKNRYISFSPIDAGGTEVAYRLDTTDSTFFPDTVGTTRWIGDPDADNLAGVESEPIYRSAWPETVHVGSCHIVPASVYAVSATDGVATSDPLALYTIIQPIPKNWGDIAGPFIGGEWTAPNGTVSMDDVMALLQVFQATPGALHMTRGDLHDNGPNRVVNMSDVMIEVGCFRGDPYPYGSATDPCE